MEKRRSITIAMSLSALAIGVAFIYVMYVYPKLIKPAETYSRARTLFNGGNYMQAALELESIPKYSEAAKLSKQSWKLAGDQAYNEGNFDVASACYVKAGSNEEDVARMDECYLRLAENAFINGELSRGEIYLDFVTKTDENVEKTDTVRIEAAKRILDGGINEESIESALTRLEACSEGPAERITDMLTGWGERALNAFDMESGKKLLSAAKRFCPEAKKQSLDARINTVWTEAGKRALEHDMEAFAQKCFDISGYEYRPDNSEEIYLDAAALMEGGDLFGALAQLQRLGGYKDSRALSEDIKQTIRASVKSGADGAYAVLGSDGAVKLFGAGWETGEPDWTGVKKIAVGSTPFILGLFEDGTVRAAGNGAGNGISVSSWTDIVDIACGSRFAIGLRSDGTAVFAGAYENSLNDTGNWKNVVSISAGRNASYGVLQNGIVVSSGDNTYGQCDVSSWTDVVFVSAGAYHTVALKEDGTLLCCGRNENGECDTVKYKDVLAVSAGSNYTVIVFADGTSRVIGKFE